MTRRPRRSAPWLVGGLLSALVVGPLAVLAGAVVAASSMAASFYGIANGPGSGSLVLIFLGTVLILAGWVAAIIGLYRLASTVDALGVERFAQSMPPPANAGHRTF